MVGKPLIFRGYIGDGFLGVTKKDGFWLRIQLGELQEIATVLGLCKQ